MKGRKRRFSSAVTQMRGAPFGVAERRNKRGEALVDLIFSKNLTIINNGTQPTFITCRAASTIDVTLATGETANLVRNWRVHPDDFSSDHRLIEFGITISAQPPIFS